MGFYKMIGLTPLQHLWHQDPPNFLCFQTGHAHPAQTSIIIFVIQLFTTRSHFNCILSFQWPDYWNLRNSEAGWWICLASKVKTPIKTEKVKPNKNHNNKTIHPKSKATKQTPKTKKSNQSAKKNTLKNKTSIIPMTLWGAPRIRLVLDILQHQLGFATPKCPIMTEERRQAGKFSGYWLHGCCGGSTRSFYRNPFAPRRTR